MPWLYVFLPLYKIFNKSFPFIAGKEIQKKWKNLEDVFARELATRRKSKSGDGAKKRR